MTSLAKGLRAVACAALLAMTALPALSYAAPIDDATSVAAASAASEAAYESDGIIVVYRPEVRFDQKSSASAKTIAQSGQTPMIATRSQPVEGMQGATAKLLSQDAGIDGGGAAVRVDLPEQTSVQDAIAAAQSDARVAYAQPIYRYRLLGDSASAAAALLGGPAPLAAAHTPAALPNDPVLQETQNVAEAPNQWWIPAVNAPAAWEIAHGDDNEVAVAVLDTGVNFDHPDLKANLLADYAYDACADKPLTESPSSEEMAHGSHVAGIIAAEANNGTGIAGVSYNAKVLPICVFRLEFDPAEGYEHATCSDEDLIRAYDYLLSDKDGNGLTVAQETHTRVVNMSLGGYIADDPSYEYDYAFEAKIEQAQDAGILTVAAGGNGDGYGNPRTDASYPCDYDAVMAVIALKDANTRATWSDYNDKKNISAPGCNIYSTWYYGDSYHMSDGTSMASPLVAGCAALLWAYDPNLSVDDVKDVLYSTADDLGAQGFDPQYGWGRVNIGAALASLGTASVKAERPAMTVAESQKLTATAIKNPDEPHAWKWSVDDASKARVSQDGVLTALAPGKVEVTVQSTDGTEPALVGHRTIAIDELAIPDGVLASANPSENTVALMWKHAAAAVKYRIGRATEQGGAYAELGTYEASELVNGENAVFVDRGAQPSTPYWYQVVPIGLIDGADVVGREATSNRCYYADKLQLREAIAQAQDLLNATKVSVDGAGLLVTEYWTPAAARVSLNAALSDALTAFWSGSVAQDEVNAKLAALEQAQEAFQAARKPGADKLPNDELRLKAANATLQFAYSPNAARVVSAKTLWQASGAHGVLTYAKAAGPAGVSIAADGTLALARGMAVGSYAVRVTATSAGDDTYQPASASATLTVRIAKAPNPLVAKAKSPRVKYAKKARTIKRAQAFALSGAAGTLRFAKVGASKLKINAKTGNITVPKKLKRGTYPIKVKVSAAGNGSYDKASKTLTVRVRVK